MRGLHNPCRHLRLKCHGGKGDRNDGKPCNLGPNFGLLLGGTSASRIAWRIGRVAEELGLHTSVKGGTCERERKDCK
jgi:hypothetical protein